MIGEGAGESKNRSLGNYQNLLLWKCLMIKKPVIIKCLMMKTCYYENVYDKNCYYENVWWWKPVILKMFDDKKTVIMNMFDDKNLLLWKCLMIKTCYFQNIWW